MITLEKLKKLIILERMAVALMAGSITLAWDANTEPDLAGYNIYYGQTSGDYGTSLNVGNVTERTITGFVNGKTYYFAATAYDEDNNESAFSEELVHTFDGVPVSDEKPNPPKSIRK